MPISARPPDPSGNRKENIDERISDLELLTQEFLSYLANGADDSEGSMAPPPARTRVSETVAFLHQAVCRKILTVTPEQETAITTLLNQLTEDKQIELPPDAQRNIQLIREILDARKRIKEVKKPDGTPSANIQ